MVSMANQINKFSGDRKSVVLCGGIDDEEETTPTKLPVSLCDD
jgi:hypothetical protein